MLDLNHPQTQYVFAAARLEDGVRMLLVQWRDSGTPPAELIATISKSINALQELNAKHFGNASGITRTLETLRSAINTFDLAASWSAFMALADTPGDNFGTWTI